MEKEKSKIRRKNKLKFKNKLYEKNKIDEEYKLTRLGRSLTNVGKPWNPDNPQKCSGARSRRNLAKKNKGDYKKRKTASKRELSPQMKFFF